MKKWVAIALLALGIGAGYYFYAANGNSAPSFRTATVERGLVIATISASGVLDPLTLVQVGSQVSGTIDKIYVDFNDKVKAGQIICQLDQTALNARVSEDRANLLKAKAQVERVNANLRVAKHDFKRAQRLHADSLISDSELDRAQAERDALAAELAVAKASVKQSESALDKAITNLGYATIRSPVDGVVILRNVDVGQTVAASLQAPVLFEIAENLDNMNALASVSEADIGAIKVGQAVIFTVDAYPDKKFSGSVLQIRLSPTVEQNVVTYTVVVSAANPERKLLPGMTANINFEIGRTAEGALRVANAALRFIPPEGLISEDSEKLKRGQRSLWAQNSTALKQIPVKTGLTDGRFTEILESGLKAGQLVVTGIMEPESKGEMRNPFMSRWSQKKKKKKGR